MKPGIRFESNPPRPDWRARVEAEGLIWHGAGDVPYWSEDEHLVLTLKAAETLEEAASELHALCLEACDAIVKRKKRSARKVSPTGWKNPSSAAKAPASR